MEVSLTICWSAPPQPPTSHDWVPLEFITLTVALIELQQFTNFNSVFQLFLPWHWFPLMCLLSSMVWLPVFTCLSLQSWGQLFTLCPPLSFRSKKSWFFSPFTFSHVIWMVCWLLSSSHTEQEFTQNIHFLMEKDMYSLLLWTVLQSKLLGAKFMTFSFTT